MSATLRELIDTVEDWVGDTSDPELTRKEINRSIRFICTRHRLDALTETRELTLSSGGFVSPVLARQIVAVRMAGDVGIRTGNRFPADGLVPAYKRIVPNGINKDAFVFVRISGDEGESQFTQDTVQDDSGWGIPADCVGKAIRIDGLDDLFEITAAVEDTSVDVDPKIGISVSGNRALIGNNGLPIYKVYDSNGDLGSGNVEVEYQRYHPYLYDLEDRLLPDIRESVSLTAVKSLLRHYKYDVDAQRLDMDLQAAIAAELGAQITSRTQPENRLGTFSVRRKQTWRRSLNSR